MLYPLPTRFAEAKFQRLLVVFEQSNNPMTAERAFERAAVSFSRLMARTIRLPNARVRRLRSGGVIPTWKRTERIKD